MNKEVDTVRVLRGIERCELSCLEGNVVRSVFVSDDQGYLKFLTDKGEFTFAAYGDCCSESWFADIIGINTLFNQEVIITEEVSMAHVQQDDRCRQEYDQFYGFKITTNKGVTDIIFRNSSNGYYGGSLERVLPGHDISSVKFIQITDDWSA